MMYKKKGQLSVELSIFLVVLLLVFIIIFSNSLSYVSATNKQVSNYVVRDALNDVSLAAQRVYLGGNNSQEVVRIQLPRNTDGSLVNVSVIGIFTINTQKSGDTFLHDVGIPVSGSLPSTGGIFDINVTSNGSTVILTY